MNILIATGIYPPALGGPAQYAYNMGIEWGKAGHKVGIKTYTFEHKLPKVISHMCYFLKIIPAVIWADFIYGLDTSAVGFPAVFASKIFGKKIIIRTGGDRLWEEYVERTRKLVLFKDFYVTTRNKWSLKDRALFKVSQWTMQNVSALVFSTAWQRDIFISAYDLPKDHIHVIENYYGPKEESFEPIRKDFIAGARPLQWKNIQILKEVFTSPEIIDAGATYHKETCPHGEFMDKIAHSYASLLVSLGDISPNIILDTIRHNKPFIITEENGLMDRIKDIAITVNPKDPKDIKNKILWLCNKENYDAQVQKIKNFNFTHTWEQIAREVIELYKKL